MENGKNVKQKKKKPRIRNRKRNKCNRIESTESTSLKKEDNSSSPKEQQENNIVTKPTNQKEIASTCLSQIGTAETTEKMQNTAGSVSNPSGKTREEVMAEREAKKLAKQAKKSKVPQNTTQAHISNDTTPLTMTATSSQVNPTKNQSSATIIKNESERQNIKSQREVDLREKQTGKEVNKVKIEKISQQLNSVQIATEDKTVATKTMPSVDTEKKKPVLTKAERRAIQEAQRTAKAQALMQKKNLTNMSNDKQVPNIPALKEAVNNRNSPPTTKTTKTSTSPAKVNRCTVKLFNHLESAQTNVNLFLNNTHIHPSIARLGEQYVKRTIVGSNARCIAFMNALKMVIQDFETPPKKEFARSLEKIVKDSVEHLQRCRPLAVSVSNAYKHIKYVLTQLPTDRPESELKENLCHFIDTYIENQIGKAAQAISSAMQEKIKNGDVILTFGCSSLIHFICEEAQRRGIDFKVIVVDSRPFCEGQELLRRLTANEIPCTYVLINAIGFVMPEVTKVLLGAHALLSNGYVMARTGTAQVALMAKSFNVPVLVCCETHKFSERFQTDAIVYNELGDPHDLVLSEKCCLTNWQSKNKMTPLNLMYDITPPELVTAVVTEVAVLPCTSVPVILRIKPTEIGYYS